MSHTPSVDRRFFQSTATGLASLGFDVAAACSAAGIDNPLEGNGERIALAKISPVYDLAARQLDDPALIYRLVEVMPTEGTSLLFRLVGCCDTPLAMLRFVCRFSGIASDVVRYEFIERRNEVILRIVPSHDAYVSLHQIEMAAWLADRWLKQLQAMAGVRVERQVAFAHAARFEPSRYAAFYGAPVTFSATWTQLSMPRDALCQLIAGHDERKLAYYRSMAERYEVRALSSGSLAEQSSLLFMQRMAFGEPDAAEIAAQLNISRRTLQRKLLEAGSTWRDVTEVARRRVAERELQNRQRPLHEIALLTGFADTRAFLRAFKRWTGLTPTQYRAGLAN